MRALHNVRAPKDHAELAAILDVALRAGYLQLAWGADTHRVEEMVHRLGTALGAEWMEVYVTPTGIIATAQSGDEHRTKIRRNVRGGIDLARIDAVNQLSRRTVVEGLDRATVEAALDGIEQMPAFYGRWLVVCAVALSCAAFAALFGGDWRAAVGALVAGSIATAARSLLLKLNVGSLLTVTPVAVLATVLAVPLCQWLGGSVEAAVPAAVITLVPGVPLINAFGDLVAGDVISGVARAAGAALIAAEIAVGVALGLALWMG